MRGIQRKRGHLDEAYGQYLRLVEQYPQNLEGRTALAEMALQLDNWDEAERHGRAAAQLAPEDPGIQAITVTLDYRSALAGRDPVAASAARDRAADLIAAHPDLIAARRIVLDALLRTEDWRGAATTLEAGIALAPDAADLQMMRLGILEKLGDDAGVEAQIKALIARNPQAPDMHRLLVRWYVAQGRGADAETHLRSLVDPDADTPDAMTTLVLFLSQTRGPEAARAELDTQIAADDQRGGRHGALLKAMRAGLDFDAGRQAEAIAGMEAILETATPSAETRNIKIGLARMLIGTGNPVGARALAEEVLAEDPGDVAALKLKAAWLIEDDRTGDAIVTLRAALGESPRDPELMTLMARAHERDGNRQLMGEMLALAVDASGNAPDETLRYAAFLTRDGRLLSAEGALLAALRTEAGTGADSLPLLVALGNIYIGLNDWPRADQVTTTISRLEAPGAGSAARELTARRLAAQNRTGDLFAFLQDLSEDGEGGLAADLAIIRTHAERGDRQAALAHADARLEKDPGNSALRFIRAAVLGADERYDEAGKIYRELLAETPASERLWTALYRLHAGQGDHKGALGVLDEALAQLPDSAMMRFNKAAALEQVGEIDAAIAIYEDLYARDSNAQVIANNLASLLATHRDDADSLERAELIARRLRDTDFAPFQDTYGWIAHRRGNDEEALSYLEPAAADLPGDASVQYHLGMVLDALGRGPEALTQLEKAATMTDRDAPPTWAGAMDDAIARLKAADAGESN